MLIPKFQNKTFPNFLIFVTNFTFVAVRYLSLQIKFSFINEIFNLKTSLEACFYDAFLYLTDHLSKVRIKFKST